MEEICQYSQKILISNNGSNDFQYKILKLTINVQLKYQLESIIKSGIHFKYQKMSSNFLDIIENTFNLSIRLRNIKLNNKKIVNSESYTINCKINNQLICDFQKSQLKQMIIRPSEAQIHKQSIVMNKFQKLNIKNTNKSQLERSKYYPSIKIKKGNQKDWEILMNKKYKCSYHDKAINIQMLNEGDIQLKFYSINKNKFAKTSILQSLFKQNSKQAQKEAIIMNKPQNQWKKQQDIYQPGIQALKDFFQTKVSNIDKYNFKFGILSMDQSARILVQEYNSNFPAIGIWCKCSDIDHILVYNKIVQYLRTTRSSQLQKCCFEISSKKYIYFAKISYENIPQLYLVSWDLMEIQRPQNYCQKTKKQVNFSKKQTIIQFGRAYLQFTLRGDGQQKFTSPTKFISDEEMSSRLQNIKMESPGFSSIKKLKSQINQKDQLENQCQTLRNRVLSQDNQIFQLKKQVEFLTAELFKTKKCITSPPNKPLNAFRSPIQINNPSSTPRTKCKKLSQSDLYISASGYKSKLGQSQSTKQKKSLQGSNSNSNSHEAVNLRFNDVHKQIAKLGINEENQDPWQYMEIVE